MQGLDGLAGSVVTFDPWAQALCLRPPLNQGCEDVLGKLCRRAGCEGLADLLVQVGGWFGAEDNHVGNVPVTNPVSREVTIGTEDDALGVRVGL